MKIGIIRYPGSNCDMDTYNYFGNAEFIWHKETELPNIDLLIIPGGFAFGDRYYEKATDQYTISPGQMAIEAPASTIIHKAVEKKIPILGICNGFQILIKLGLLPGSLIKNKTNTFICKKIKCLYSFDSDDVNYKGDSLMWVAHGYGNYQCDTSYCSDLINNNQIFLTYDNFDNGSMNSIAGICNKEKTIFGMMPHPERNSGFKEILLKILFYKQFSMKKRIYNLMTSEHISYKSTKKYLKKLYTKGEKVIQGPGENAGIIDIGEDYAIALRIESHNHPTYINPFEGAATGVGGIMRDIFTMGARPIALLDFLRFGTNSHSNELLNKAIEGISYYTNCIGVPNVGGDLYRGETYNKNPLVNVACIGLIKKENIIYGNALNKDSVLIYVGSKTGYEGVDGASMASQELDQIFDKNIQKSDPFLEKLLMEACCEIAELNLAEGMQDMGAGGFLCASIEVVQRGREKTKKNLGCIIDLDKIPIKYEMDPYSILASESQERMLIISTPKNTQKIEEIFKKWDLEYSIVGKVTEQGFYSIYKNDLLIYDEQMINYRDVEEHLPEIHTAEPVAPEKIKDPSLWEVYDTSIGNRVIKGPSLPESYAILDIYENKKKLILTWGEEFMECYDCMKKNKGMPLAIVNCLNFGNPNKCMGNFSEKLTELNKLCTKHKVPIVGGNISLYNATDGVNIKSTIVILMIGLL